MQPCVPCGLPLFNVGIQNRQGCQERQSFCPNWESKPGLRVQSPVRYPLGYHFTQRLRPILTLNIGNTPHKATFSMELMGASRKSPNSTPWGNGSETLSQLLSRYFSAPFEFIDPEFMTYLIGAFVCSGFGI